MSTKRLTTASDFTSFQSTLDAFYKKQTSLATQPSQPSLSATDLNTNTSTESDEPVLRRSLTDTNSTDQWLSAGQPATNDQWQQQYPPAKVHPSGRGSAAVVPYDSDTITRTSETTLAPHNDDRKSPKNTLDAWTSRTTSSSLPVTSKLQYNVDTYLAHLKEKERMSDQEHAQSWYSTRDSVGSVDTYVYTSRDDDPLDAPLRKQQDGCGVRSERFVSSAWREEWHPPTSRVSKTAYAETIVQAECRDSEPWVESARSCPIKDGVWTSPHSSPEFSETVAMSRKDFTEYREVDPWGDHFSLPGSSGSSSPYYPKAVTNNRDGVDPWTMPVGIPPAKDGWSMLSSSSSEVHETITTTLADEWRASRISSPNLTRSNTKQQDKRVPPCPAFSDRHENSSIEVETIKSAGAPLLINITVKKHDTEPDAESEPMEDLTGSKWSNVTGRRRRGSGYRARGTSVGQDIVSSARSVATHRAEPLVAPSVGSASQQGRGGVDDKPVQMNRGNRRYQNECDQMDSRSVINERQQPATKLCYDRNFLMKFKDHATPPQGFQPMVQAIKKNDLNTPAPVVQTQVRPTPKPFRPTPDREKRTVPRSSHIQFSHATRSGGLP
ncbi:hypothetical protein BGX31_004507 [Mortierella sp. GBA43]|nr:hypothetical protein BGX31_004507 [Mortierella sp. GBA43]